MRLWHYKLIPFLPNSQLKAQWRELNSIFKKQDHHILINYVYEYPKDDLFTFTIIVLREMDKRGIAIRSWDNFDAYFNKKPYECLLKPFTRHHNRRYLRQCYYNLEEKFDRGQKDFSDKQYTELLKFIKGEDL